METEERVIKILNELCGNEVQNVDQSLANELMLDSLNMVILLLEIEEKFDIQLDESDMNPLDLQTVSDVIRLAEKYCDEKRTEQTLEPENTETSFALDHRAAEAHDEKRRNDDEDGSI